MEKNNKSDEKLQEIKNKRQQCQDEYDAIKKRNSEIRDYIDSKKYGLDRIMDGDSVSSDPDMKAFYEAKLQRLKKLQENEMEFQYSIDKKFRQVNDELDEEEKIALKQMEEEQDNQEEEEKEEGEK